MDEFGRRTLANCAARKTSRPWLALASGNRVLSASAEPVRAGVPVRDEGFRSVEFLGDNHDTAPFWPLPF